MIEKQQVIFSLTPSDDGKLDISLSFEPALIGDKAKERADMTEIDRQLQGYAGHIATEIMEALGSA